MLLSFLLVSLVVFLGIYAGIALAFIAPEELAPGRKYFGLMRTVAQTLVFTFLFHLLVGSAAAAPFVAVIVFCVLFWLFHSFDDAVQHWLSAILYALDAVALAIAFQDIFIFSVCAVLVFFYGFPEGSIYAARHYNLKTLKPKTSKGRIILYAAARYGLFLLLGNVLHYFVL
ncbi:hypothetical protein JXB02_00290 [Candidatus Woesearchaeota archaeon]|nr:hypothetical protein [Candidatus Woesearchaeota archaeon]